MPRVSFSSKKKRTRITRSLTKNQKLEVVKLAKRQIEVKHQLVNMEELAVNYNKFYTTQLFPWIVQGTGDQQRVGDRIKDVFLKASIGWSTLNNQTSVLGRVFSEGSILRVILLRTQDKVSFSGLAENNYKDDTPTFAAGSSQVLIDSTRLGIALANPYSRHKILKQWFIKPAPMNQGVSGAIPYQSCQVLKNIYAKVPAQQYVDGTGNQYGLKFQYHLCVMTSIPQSSSTDTAGYLHINYDLSYKDA